MSVPSTPEVGWPNAYRNPSNDIAIHVIDATCTRGKSGEFVLSGVIVVNDERLARMTREVGVVRYELFNLPEAAAKWARVVQHAEATLEDAFAPLDEFLGVLWADALER